MNSFSNPLPVLESLEPRLAPAGVVALTTSGTVLTITGDVDANDFQITDAGGGMWSVSGLAGSTTLFKYNGGPASASLLIAQPTVVKANLGGGNDEMNLVSLHLTGALTINGNDGDDAILLSGTTVNGAVTVDMGVGADDVDFTSTTFASTVSVKMGAGADYFTAGGALVFNKGFSVDLGAGANTFDLNAGSLQSGGNLSAVAGGTPVEGQAFVFAAGTGAVTGAVTLRTTTASPTTFEIGDQVGDDLRISAGFTIQAGAGDDTVTLREKIQVGTLLNIQLGNGNNAVVTTDLDALKAGSLTYGGGSNTDNVTIKGNTVAVTGNLTFSGGAGTNTLDLNPATSLRIGGGLLYTGSVGNDTLFIDGPDAAIGGQVNFNASNGTNYLAFDAVAGSAGSLVYTGGTGTDTVDLGEYTGLSTLITIRGNTTLNLGGGSADAQLRNVDVYGNLTINSNVPFGAIDTTQILETDVGGNTSINVAGAADADVIVRDSIFDHAVTVSTGGGDDYVGFDTDTAVSSIYSAFYGPVKVLLGAGNDVFAAGDTPAVDTVGCDFYSSVLVDGGTGYDWTYFLDSDYNNGFNGPVPLVYNVEKYY